MKCLKNLFKKPPVAKFRVVQKKVKLPKLVQNTIIRLKNGEVRHLRRESSRKFANYKIMDLVTGEAHSHESPNPIGYVDTDITTAFPEAVHLVQCVLGYLDDLGNHIEIHGEDVQEIIRQPPTELKDTFEVTVNVLEPIE